ncbi:RNA polymerase sigma factor [Geovibrio thiophilus]|uniref:RNA polymerase sigma factor n=1 Tax=Geovibrio thiophilus TaxID=139438 RepID=A0A3R5V291_9BACT|nr:RNA polymerase sigma factor [Geovibrio thiophilus]QAR33815.1 RNA polymerase sigma factor [Geovibrio thiophilus]
MNSNSLLRNFFEENSGRLFGYLLKLSGCREDAEDLHQECFLKYARNYPDNYSLPLLYTVAKSLFIDLKRKSRDHDELSGNESGHTANPEEIYSGKEETDMLMRALAMLDDDERELISLCSSGGMKYSEVSSVTGLSEANIKVKIHRARKKLKEIISESRK